LEELGCFAMSEVGHGSNVAALETVARYEHETRELVIVTPSESARKEWIGGAARDARFAVVFAQLEVAGVRHGVHAIIVPIRAADGSPLPGVRTGDSGHKMGLLGVDNGRLWFEHTRVPVSHLLDRFASIDASGSYQSPIESQGRRFFTMLGTLVGGRICVGSAAVSAARRASPSPCVTPRCGGSLVGLPANRSAPCSNTRATSGGYCRFSRKASSCGWLSKPLENGMAVR
jgi:acyl-CoA oxidase